MLSIPTGTRESSKAIAPAPAPMSSVELESQESQVVANSRSSGSDSGSVISFSSEAVIVSPATSVISLNTSSDIESEPGGETPVSDQFSPNNESSNTK